MCHCRVIAHMLGATLLVPLIPRPWTSPIGVIAHMLGATLLDTNGPNAYDSYS